MLLLSILFTTLSWSVTVPKSLLQYRQLSAKKNEVIVMKPQKEHHFSMEAPQKCGEYAPVDKTTQTVKCQFAEAGEVNILVNICDDEKTFCKPERFKVTIIDEVSATDRLMAVPQKLADEEAKKAEQDLIPGFETTDWKTIASSKSDSPQLLVVSTKWCPPCNALKDFTFSDPEFQKSFGSVKKWYVDGDSPAGRVLSDHLKYAYYPSLILLNSNDQEIDRITGFQTTTKLSQWLSQTGDLTPIQKIIKTVENRQKGRFIQKVWDYFADQEKIQEDLKRSANWHHSIAESEKAEELLNQLSDKESQMKVVESRYFDIKGDKEKEEEALALAVALIQERPEPESYFVYSYCGMVEKDLCLEQLEAFKKVDEEFQKTLESDIDRWIYEGNRDFYLSLTYKKLEDKTRAKQLAENCIAIYKKLEKKSTNSFPRFVNQKKLSCLKQAEQNIRYLALLERMIQAYPYEPTFIGKKVDYLMKEEKWQAALYEIDKAMAISYGRTYLALNVKKVTALKEMGKTEDAKSHIEKVLAEVNMPKESKTSIHRHVQKLRELQKTL